MMQLHQDFTAFEAKDAAIVVIGPEDATAFKAYWKKNNLPFIGLPDEKHVVLKLYGQKVNLFKLGRMPAQMIIDKGGMLRYVHYGHSMEDIPGNDELMSLLDSLGA